MTSIILAKLFGIYFITLGLAFLLNPKHVGKVYEQIMTSDSFLFFSGIIALLLGAFVLSVHNVWTVGWPVLITVIGWLSLFKGIWLLFYPKLAESFSFMFKNTSVYFRVNGLIILVLGAFLLYHGLA